MLWGIHYTGPNGSGVVGPLRSRHYASLKADKLLATGQVTAAEVYEIEAWVNVRERFGIERSQDAIRDAEYRKERLANGGDTARMVDATGAHRRLQALMSIGWSLARLELEADLRTWQLRKAFRNRRIRRETHDVIAQVYRRFSHVTPPARTKGERISVNRTKGNARLNGYAVPAAWDDDTIDDPEAKPFGMAA